MSTIKVDTIATRTGSGNITLSNSLTSATIAGDLTVDTSTLKVDSSNNRVGIGTTSPNANTKLDVNGAARIGNSTDGIMIENNTGSFDINNAAYIRRNASSGALELTSGSSTARNMIFNTGTDGAESMRLDTSGRAMIGTTTEGQSAADDLTVASSGNTGITIRAGTTSSGSAIYMSDATSGTGEYAGYIAYSHSADSMAIGAAAGQRIRIDSDGLKFGSDTAAANALNDYEEGTFTGVGMSAASGGAFTITSQDNAYVKIGKFVKLRIKLIMNTPSSASGNITLTGLPFASDGIYGMHIVYNNQSSSYNNDGGFFISGTQAVKYSYSTTFQNITGFQIWMEASYRTT